MSNQWIKTTLPDQTGQYFAVLLDEDSEEGAIRYKVALVYNEDGFCSVDSLTDKRMTQKEAFKLWHTKYPEFKYALHPALSRVAAEFDDDELRQITGVGLSKVALLDRSILEPEIMSYHVSEYLYHTSGGDELFRPGVKLTEEGTKHYFLTLGITGSPGPIVDILKENETRDWYVGSKPTCFESDRPSHLTCALAMAIEDIALINHTWFWEEHFMVERKTEEVENVG